MVTLAQATMGTNRKAIAAGAPKKSVRAVAVAAVPVTCWLIFQIISLDLLREFFKQYLRPRARTFLFDE